MPFATIASCRLGETGVSSRGGALFEIGVHHFDLWRFLLGSEVASIHAYSKSEHGLDETVSVSAQMANGVPVSAFFSEQTSDANELEILGRKGRLRLSIYEFDGLYFQSILSRLRLSPGPIPASNSSKTSRVNGSTSAIPAPVSAAPWRW